MRDPNDQNLIAYPLAGLVHTHLLLLGQGWRDQDDADRLCEDPVLTVIQNPQLWSLRIPHPGNALFQPVNEYSAENGLAVSRSTIVDATLIDAPTSIKNKEGKRDPEMHQAKMATSDGTSG